MKRIASLVCAVLILVSVRAQQSPLYIATDKTISLVFPFAIRHVDRGTKDVLVQPVEEANNILLVKAAIKDFEKTNLSIITEDGSIYSFPIYYGEPMTLIYRLPEQSKASVASYARSIVDKGKTMTGIRDASWEMIATVNGIYIKDNIIYCQLLLNNYSPIDYDIAFLRFYIRDLKKSKRTAIQETELVPVYKAGNTTQVKAGSQNQVVLAFEKFTIPDAQYLAIEIGEKNGGRNLSLKVGNRKLMKAIVLSDLK